MTKVSAEERKERIRKLLLSVILVGMGVWFGGQWVLESLIQGPLERERAQTERLRRNIKEREEGLIRIREASKMLEIWESQSLPSDPEVARSLYQAWLVELIDDVGLTSPSVTSSEPVLRRGVYYTLSFSVRGRGTLEKLTRLLFAIYQTDLLHQVRSIAMTPLQRADQMDISLSLEALAVAGRTESEDAETVFEEFRRRTWRTSDRLAYNHFDAYQTIVGRNLFGMGGGALDASDFTVLTSINEVNGEPEVWFTVQSTDQVIRRRVGESFQVGSLALEVVEAFGPDVVVEVDGERWLLTLGENITDAFALPPGF